MHSSMHVYVHVHTRAHARMHVYGECMHPCMCACLSVYACALMYTRHGHLYAYYYCSTTLPLLSLGLMDVLSTAIIFQVQLSYFKPIVETEDCI